MKKISIILSLFSLLLLVSCDDPYEGNITPATEGSPIATRLESEPGKFSQWVDLLKHADMFNTMNLKASYTAFVPTNEGIDKYLQAHGYASVNDVPVSEAELLIKYHTIKGHEYPQTKFVNGLLPDTTATGDYLSIEIRAGGLNAMYVNGVSHINTLDIPVTNGVLHAIDDVLIPVTGTIWEKINSGKYTIMAQAIQETGLDSYLHKLNSSKIKRTLFAVSDETYRRNNIEDFNKLLEVLGVPSGADLTRSRELNYYLYYHILTQQTDYNSLASFSEGVTSKNIAPFLSTELINISVVDNNLFINYDKQTKTGISITEANINAKNGIIHVVDNFMPIVTPVQTTVQWDLADYSVLSSISFYRKPDNSGKTTQYTSLVGNWPCYTWESVPLEKSNAVQYYVYYGDKQAGYGDASGRYDFLHQDGLSLSLGLYGWIEMQTPVIVKGTYIVKINCYSIGKTTKDGKFLTIVDGNGLGGEVAVNGSETTKSQIYKHTIGTITFDETKSHTVRLIQTDAQTISLDYIEFVPVY